MKKLSLKRTDEMFSILSAQQKLYIPAEDASGQSVFTLWREGVTLSDDLNTARSPKDLFFPQVENLVGFRVTGKQIDLIETRDETEPFVLFGVRACDVKSFDILDRVFLSKPCDTYYKSRRENATIVSLACKRPAETCFCNNFGVDAGEPGGDVSCWITGGDIYLRENTEKGKRLMDSIPVLEECGDEAVERAKNELKKVMEKLPLKSLSLERFKEENTLSLFNDGRWAKLSESCLGCGSCTFVCPTCQCYDIKEFKNGNEVRRFRCWDSCMYSDFTKMSAGQPRPTQKERFRQRFMHKLVYFPANNDGVYGCVGCGRCLIRCPISMNIAKVIKTLGEEKE